MNLPGFASSLLLNTLKEILAALHSLLEEMFGIREVPKLFGGIVEHELGNTRTSVGDVEDDACCLEFVDNRGVVDLVGDELREEGDIVLAGAVEELAEGAYAVHSVLVANFEGETCW